MLRVGQLCGHARTEHWNTDVWVPILVATRARLGALLEMVGKSVGWVSVDVAAATVSDLLLSPADPNSKSGYAVHNRVNPKPIPWPPFLELLQAALAAEGNERLGEVSTHEWVRRLNGVADEDVPELRLLAVFEDMAGDESVGEGFETGSSEEMSGTLRGCGEMCGECLAGNLRAWRKS